LVEPRFVVDRFLRVKEIAVKYSFVALVVCIFLLGVGCSEPVPVEEPAVIDDITQAAPESAKRLVENEWVTVTSFELKPRAELPMHDGKDRVVITLSRYRAVYGTPEGSAGVKEYMENDINWYDAGMHEISNAGATTAKFISIERNKPWPAPEKESGLLKAVAGFGKIQLNNNEARVVEVGLVPKGRVPKHDGNMRVIVPITDSKISFSTPEGTEEKEFTAGDAHWHDAGSHALRNIGEENISFLVVEFKP
jgi:quercetin dioxygenase-like cupin family protein